MTSDAPLLADGAPDWDEADIFAQEGLRRTSMGVFDGFHLRGIPVDRIHEFKLDRLTLRSVCCLAAEERLLSAELNIEERMHVLIRLNRDTRWQERLGRDHPLVVQARSLPDRLFHSVRDVVSNHPFWSGGFHDHPHDLIPANLGRTKFNYTWVDLLDAISAEYFQIRFQTDSERVDLALPELRQVGIAEYTHVWQRVDGFTVVLSKAFDSPQPWAGKPTSAFAWDGLAYVSDEFPFIEIDGERYVCTAGGLDAGFRAVGAEWCDEEEAVRRAVAAGWAPGAGFYDDWTFEGCDAWWDGRFQNLVKRWLLKKGYSLPLYAYADYATAEGKGLLIDDRYLWKRIPL